MARHIAVLLALALAAAIARAQRVEAWIAGLEKPCAMAFDPTDASRLFVVEQTGRVRVAEDGNLLDAPFIAVDPDNFTTPDSNWERGLLGLAFDPGYADNKRFYLYYTDKGGDVVLSRFTAESPKAADWSSEQVILKINEPYGNHNGGCIRFGPDGLLYLGPGDGGSANDPKGNGQNLDTLLGKIVRIDVTSDPDPGLAYAIPKDNPFVDRDDARPEIWAYGLRNPWRFEFDSKGRLWIGDVGQNRFEEIDLQPEGSKGGENYGWNTMEGLGEFREGRSRQDDPARLRPAEHAERGLVAPIHEYRQSPVGSVTGGYFYEGTKYTWLRNRYICADFMTGQVWSFRLRTRDGFTTADDVADHTGPLGASFGGRGSALAIASFGLSPDGQTLYIVDHNAGRILRFIDE
ncbi:MAG: PQQ-dependent sugar dehydrogenase [Phycisphaeraceae bacterium]|nr:MAG: PQQ-dependent sugar dehydrogenase [Phycisphaeraceae bacterium]